MTKGTLVQNHVLKMIDLITKLGQLGFNINAKLNQDLILQSLGLFFPVCGELSHEQTGHIPARAIKYVENS